jgi:phospholipase/lecithinase/hemolysin
MPGTIRLRKSTQRVSVQLESNQIMKPATKARRSQCILSVAVAFLFAFTAALANAKDYTRIVVFGDSLSDSGNVAHLTEAKFGIRVPGTIADYTDGHFTDGFDTIPAAQKYFGVWIEQLAASMPSRPELKNSLDGGTNYAYGFATTGSGTSAFTFGPDDSLSVEVDNVDQQITDYLATHPKINNSTLFVIWAGANNLLNATSPSDIVNGAIQETLDIQRLIEAGATQFLVLNLPPLGLTPRLNGSPSTAIPATLAAELFNSYLATGLSVLHDFYPGRHVALFELDVFSLFNQIAAAPGDFALANITVSSQGNFSVDPDTYLFWDDIHPTTRGHNILAGAAMNVIASPQCDSLGMPSCAAAMN